MANNTQGPGYPFQSYSFIVDFGFQIGFQEVEGLSQTIAIVEYREVTNPFTSAKVPGDFSFSNIVLKRGKTTKKDLLAWWRMATGQDPSPSGFKRSGNIHLIQPQSQAKLASWHVSNAWPVRYEQSAWSAQASGLAIESFELAHEGVQEVSPGASR